ncbi:MAG: 5'/3'-nucleotidase SurE [Nitrososphaeria archaeon]
MQIALTNDDGPESPGLIELYNVLKKKHKVLVVVPESQRSGDGKALTFHKPLRIRETNLRGNGKAYAINGTPADAVYAALLLLEGEPDFVVSGINGGDNTTLHSIFTSGTVAAVLEAAIVGIPGMALSIDTRREAWFSATHRNPYMKKAADLSGMIMDFVDRNPFPKEIDFINVNFPERIDLQTRVKITSLARFKFRNFLRRKVDPNGVPYYWLDGRKVKRFGVDTDAYNVYVRKNISVTPVSLSSLASVDERQRAYVSALMSSVFRMKKSG